MEKPYCFNEAIMEISSLASKMKKEGISIVDATIGMLYDEEEKLIVDYNILEELRLKISEDTSKYESYVGSDRFHECIKTWIFNDVPLVSYISSSYTMGATGALSFAFKTYCSNSKLYMPSIRWGNYDSIAELNNIQIEEYNLFNIEELINNIKKEKEIKLLALKTGIGNFGFRLHIKSKFFKPNYKLSAFRQCQKLI